MSSLGLKRATSDTGLYTVNHHVHGICIVILCVCDIVNFSDFLEWIESAKRATGAQFRITEFGEATFILGIDIVRNTGIGTEN
jgi:hypothetical protein